MGKHYKTNRARVTNKGPLPRFIGLLPTDKAPDGVLVFSSITELLTGIFLAWARAVRRIEFEAREVAFEPTDNLAGVNGWPDYELTLEGGEIEWVNAKYSRSSLRDEEREQLDLFDAHCLASGRRHRIVYRDELERDGFIESILLLRPYGLLPYPNDEIQGALIILGGLPPTHIDGWHLRAREAFLPIDLVYHLLYREQLPLTYRPLMHTALRQCRN